MAYEFLSSTGLSILMLVAIIIGFIWTFAWKGRALWQASRRKQTGWFIVMLLLNTMGILPIFYLLFNKKKRFRK